MTSTPPTDRHRRLQPVVPVDHPRPGASRATPTVVRLPVTPVAAADEVDLRILGTLELTIAGQHRMPTAAKLRALLIALAVHQGRRLTTESLIDELWAAPPRTARSVIHSYVSQLRRLFAGSCAELTFETHGYRLVLPADSFDVGRFTARAAEVELVEDAANQHPRLEAALAAWRGPPVPELRLGPRTQAVLDGLVEKRTSLIERLAALEVAAGQPDRAAVALRAVVDAEPLRERTWGQLIGALAAAGRWSEALLAYEEVRGLLAEELGVEPSTPLREMHRRLLAHDRPTNRPPADPPRRSPPVALPPRLVGRDTERADLDRSLATHRLVCLTGPTGVGKTVLALDAAHRHGSVVGVVEVSACRDRRDVLQALRDALGTERRTEPTLHDLMRAAWDRSGLLLLDGCDRLLATCAELIAPLLRTAPQLRWLATSREPLRLRGEYRLAVRGLEVPPPGASVRTYRASPAVELLIERARANGWRARTDAPTTLWLGRIARELDGLPLALELAAERLVRLPAQRLHDRLADRFEVLDQAPRCVPERHRSLRAAVTSDHASLAGSDRALLTRLGLFHGPFTAADARLVVGAVDTSPSEVEDALERLVTASVLQPVDPSRSSGPVLLASTGRCLAAEELRGLPDHGELRDRHAAWVRDRLIDVRRNHGDVAERRWLLAGDVTTACAHAVQRGDAPLTTALVEAAWWHWYLVGDLRQGLDRLRAALDLPAVADSHAGARIRLRAAWFAHLLGDPTSAQLDAERADADLVHAGDLRRAGLARSLLAVARVTHDPLTATQLATDAQQLHRRVGDRRAIATSALALASVLATSGDLARSQVLAVESDQYATRGADPHGVSAAAQLLGDLAVRRGDLAAARQHLARGLEASIASHHTLGVAAVIARLASVVLAEGDPTAAASLLGAARTIAWRTGCTLDPSIPDPLEDLEARLRCSPTDLARMEAAGAQAPPAEVAREVLASAEQPRHQQPAVRDVDTAAGGSAS